MQVEKYLTHGRTYCDLLFELDERRGGNVKISSYDLDGTPGVKLEGFNLSAAGLCRFCELAQKLIGPSVGIIEAAKEVLGDWS